MSRSRFTEGSEEIQEQPVANQAPRSRFSNEEQEEIQPQSSRFQRGDSAPKSTYSNQSRGNSGGSSFSRGGASNKFSGGSKESKFTRVGSVWENGAKGKSFFNLKPDSKSRYLMTLMDKETGELFEVVSFNLFESKSNSDKAPVFDVTVKMDDNQYSVKPIK